MIIDIHTHVYPEKIAQSTVRALSVGTGLNPASDGTASGLVKTMHMNGVDRSFIMPVATNPLKVNHLNDFAFSLDGSDGLHSFGAMHPDCVYWQDELLRIKDHGLKGIKVHPVYQKTNFDDPRYLRIFERATELGLFVLTHAGYDIGFPGADNCTVDRIANALRLTGGFNVILAHMSGWGMWDAALEVLPGYGAYIDTAFSLGRYAYNNSSERDPAIQAAYGTVGNFVSQEQFARFINAFGADHILFGSDSPWDTQKTGIDFINSMPISQTDKQLILGKNAERLFF